MDKRDDAGTIEIDRHHRQDFVAQVGHFLWHLLQMVLAMAGGMAIYVALFRLVLTPEGYKAMQSEQPFLWYSEMAVFMTVPMVALMRHHGYRWRQCAEMSGAMFIPPTGLIALVQLGVTAYLPWLSTRTLPVSTHIAMLLSMFVVMLYRRAEYGESMYHRSCCHGEQSAPRRITGR
jgi:hypothetical protein